MASNAEAREALQPAYRKVPVVNATTLVQLIDFYTDAVVAVVLVAIATSSPFMHWDARLTLLIWAGGFIGVCLLTTFLGLRALRRLQLPVPVPVKVLALLQAHIVYAAWKELQRGPDAETWHKARGELKLIEAGFGSIYSTILCVLLLVFCEVTGGACGLTSTVLMLANLAVSLVGGSLGTWVGGLAAGARLPEHTLAYFVAAASFFYLGAGFMQGLLYIAWDLIPVLRLPSATLHMIVTIWVLIVIIQLLCLAASPCFAFEPEEATLTYGQRVARRWSTRKDEGSHAYMAFGDSVLVSEALLAQHGRPHCRGLFRFHALASSVFLNLPWIIAWPLQRPWHPFFVLEAPILPWASFAAVAVVRSVALAYLHGKIRSDASQASPPVPQTVVGNAQN